MQRTTVLAFLAGAAAAGSALFTTGFGPDHSNHSDHGHAHADQDGHAGHAMSPEEEMAAYMASIMPGEHHEHLAKVVGTWDAVTSFVVDPSQPPLDGTGTMECEMVLGGRYVQGHFHMDDMMGMPFDGISFAGYDNLRQEFVSTWMDSMGTGIMYMTGQMEGQKMELQGSVAAPGGEKHMKIVTEWQDDDHFTDTFMDKQPDGSWVQSGQISYTRR